MKLIIGLGNPSLEYKFTRHNVGFMYLDYIFGDVFSLNNKLKALEYMTLINDEKVIVIKPITYMNLSGMAVVNYMNYYKVNMEDILVIQDDLDMEIGKIKLLYNHGDGGHNGIKSIINSINGKAFLRLKIGISKDNFLDTKDYVLGKFSDGDLIILNRLFGILNSFVQDYISLNRDMLIQKYNSLKTDNS